MESELNKVKQWCEATDIDINKKPTNIPENRYRLRFNLMAEENLEYLEACAAGDTIEIADAIGDMLYILLGTALEHGMQDYLKKIFSEIHRSNMSKMGKEGKAIRREDGKILKGSNYFKPNISKIITE
jgi:predicted HAD superfamily Cof-like phosphohydrolase